MAITELAVRSMSHSEIKDIVTRVCEHAGVKLLALNFRDYDVSTEILVSTCGFSKCCEIAGDIDSIFTGYMGKYTFEIDTESEMNIRDEYCPVTFVYDDYAMYNEMIEDRGGIDL